MNNPLHLAHQQFQQGNFASAIDLAQTVRKTSKDYKAARSLIANAHYNIGVFRMLTMADPLAVMESYEKCLQILPGHEDANNNMAAIYFSNSEIACAIPYYQTTLKFNPANLTALLCLAICYERIDDLENAGKLYQRYSTLAPTSGIAAMRDALLIKSIVPSLSYVIEARHRTLDKLDKLIQFPKKINNPERHNGTYFYFSYHGECNKNLNKRIAQAYLNACPALGWESPHVKGWKTPSKKTLIGILSENLYDHSIGQTSSGLIAELDRSTFVVVVIHIGNPPNDPMHQRINASADHVVYIEKTSLQAAREKISALQLDIAFWQDIGMNPFSYFLSFARLAPVQVTTFGHPDTTGIPNMDYFISSDLYETQESDAKYSEQLIRLPKAGTLAYYYRPDPPSDHGRADFGLSPDEHIYICPQTLFKLHPHMDGIFDAIRQRDAKARFVLIEPKESHMKHEIASRIKQQYPDLEQRLRFIPRINEPPKYKALLNCADVMLDTLHFNGQNTNLEAFSVNLPVVTLPSNLQRGRHTLGMYKAMGFLDLVAHSTEDYADLAVRVATNPVFSAHCRKEISARSPVLYESSEFIGHLEQAFLKMVA